jgi:glycerophosphoryl diester phosphodiesterase
VALLVVLFAGTLQLSAPAAPVPDNCAAGQGIAQRPTLGTSVGWTSQGQRPQGHAHNDYEHGNPLVDALDAGLSSVEADVWAVDGELLVGHTREELHPSRTLASLYLEPLVKRYGGERSRTPTPVQLLIDVKSTPSSTLPLLRAQLSDHAAMLTSYHGCTARPGSVNVVVSGSDVRPTAPTPGAVSYFGYDLQPERTTEARPREAVTPLTSAKWETYFTWDGHGGMPRAERARLQAMVRAAHEAGSAIRFYDTPDDRGPAREALWRELVAAGVDYISTDDLAGFDAFTHDDGRSVGTRRTRV